MLKPIDPTELEFNDPPQLVWVKVVDAYLYLWGDNPKLHDIPDLKESISTHGFQEIPKYDKNIGIKAGNGRVETLYEMEGEMTWELPRGLAKDSNGKWAMPLLVGTDAATIAAASAYAIDSNNLVMTGMSEIDIAQLYNVEQYTELLNRYTHDEGVDDFNVVSVDLDELLLQMEVLRADPNPTADEMAQKHGSQSQDTDFWPMLKITISPDTLELYQSLMEDMPGNNEADKFDALLNAVDVAAAVSMRYE